MKDFIKDFKSGLVPATKSFILMFVVVFGISQLASGTVAGLILFIICFFLSIFLLGSISASSTNGYISSRERYLSQIEREQKQNNNVSNSVNPFPHRQNENERESSENTFDNDYELGSTYADNYDNGDWRSGVRDD